MSFENVTYVLWLLLIFRCIVEQKDLFVALIYVINMKIFMQTKTGTHRSAYSFVYKTVKLLHM